MPSKFRRPCYGLLLFFSLAMLPVAAWAFQPLITDDTGTQGKGGNQIEASYNRAVTESFGTKDVARAVPLVYTRGLTDVLDLYLGASHLRLEPAAPAPTESGWSNVAFGAKWRFYEDEKSKLSFGLKPEIQFPVSDNKEARGLGTGRTSYGIAMIMTQETGFGAVHANLAVNRVNFSDDALNAAQRRSLYRLSVAPVWDVAESWKLALDTGLTTNPDPTTRARMGYVELGAIYSPSKDLDFALGVIRSLADGNARTTQVTAGVTWRFR